MIKRILAGVVAAGFAATLVVSGSAGATPCNTTGPDSQTPPSGKGETVVSTPTGTRVYKTPGQPSTGGYIGVQGNNGWIEANGTASPTGGYIAGKATGVPVDGRISGTMNPDNIHVCVAEHPVR